MGESVTFSKRSYFFGFLYVLHGVKPSKILDLSLGSLINDDGNGDENDNKAIGVDWQNNYFARATLFIVHFFCRHCMTTT